MPSAFHGNRRAYSGGKPWLHYGVKPPAGFTIETPGSESLRGSVRLASGTPMVWDFLSMGIGYVKFAGGFDVIMTPYRQPLPERPSAEYQEAIQLAVLVLGHGLLRWTITSQFLINVVKLQHEQFEFFPEATRAMLPILLYTGDESHTMQKWQGETFSTPTMEVTDWITRRLDIFGPMTVRPPFPIVEQSVPPIALPPAPAAEPPPPPPPPAPPPAPANDAAPLPPAANDATPPFDGAVPYRPIPVAAPPAPAPAPGAAAANDLLAKYIRQRS